METTVIMTEVRSPLGKYTKFETKGTRRLIGSVDYTWINGSKKYAVFTGWSYLSFNGTRTSKDTAIEFAKKCILSFIEDAEFKWNVMTERIR